MPLLYREMLADGLEHDRDEAKAVIALNLPILKNSPPGLTEAGRAIFEPLRQRPFS
jgi:hypothetical protein